MKTLTGCPNKVESGFDNPPKEPLTLLKRWYSAAEAIKVREPYGFVLSTVNQECKPSSRVVLLKEITNESIIFGTSKNSRKGLELNQCSFASGNIWWRETLQQISFQGMVSLEERKISEKWFAQRNREAQAVAAISSQSERMDDETVLKEEIEKLVASQKNIACPENWSVYSFKIDEIEFWLGNKNRLHQRLKYYLHDEGWEYLRLQP